MTNQTFTTLFRLSRVHIVGTVVIVGADTIVNTGRDTDLQVDTDYTDSATVYQVVYHADAYEK